MAKGQSLQDPFLNALRKERIPVSIYLVNGIKLQGQIDSFDQFVVLLVAPAGHVLQATGFEHIEERVRIGIIGNPAGSRDVIVQLVLRIQINTPLQAGELHVNPQMLAP